jgi:hypothetical protein
VGTVLDSIADTRKAFVVDFAAVPFLDSTAANAMSRVAIKAKRQAYPAFHHRRVANGAPRAAHPWSDAAARQVPRKPLRGPSQTSKGIATNRPPPRRRGSPQGSPLP